MACSWALTLSSQVGLGVDSVLVDGVDVVLGRLQGPQLGAQVAVLAAVGASGAWEAEGVREMRGVDAEEDYPPGMECFSLEINHGAKDKGCSLTVFLFCLSLPETDS